MWKADQWKDYEVLDTSDGEKLERWGSFYLVRPDPQVIWSTPRQRNFKTKERLCRSFVLIGACRPLRA